MPRKGLAIVHTGNGKGMTTAALGLALRAVGQGPSSLRSASLRPLRRPR